MRTSASLDQTFNNFPSFSSLALTHSPIREAPTDKNFFLPFFLIFPQSFVIWLDGWPVKRESEREWRSKKLLHEKCSYTRLETIKNYVLCDFFARLVLPNGESLLFAFCILYFWPPRARTERVPQQQIFRICNHAHFDVILDQNSFIHRFQFDFSCVLRLFRIDCY